MSPWPRVEWCEDQWLPGNDGMTSRRQRARNRGAFRYAVVPRIAKADPGLPGDVMEEARTATASLERFDTRHEGLGTPFASVLLRSESASSSQIENLTASARRISLATLGETRSPNAVGVARNVDAMRAAIALADDLGSDSILAMHRALAGGDDPANAGRFRREWVWIGGASPVSATYVAPNAAAISELIQDLVAFMRRTDLEPLTQAALAHAQFETIHPFTDGNGRTGRAVVSSLLRYRGVMTTMMVPISSGLLTDTEAYFRALTSYRHGDIEPIVAMFAAAANAAVANATLLQADVATVREQVLGFGQRRTANLVAMAEMCATEPAFTIEMVRERGIATSTAYRWVERLTSAGVLRRERAIRGVDAWTVVPLTDALDEFARRSGRRTFNRA